MISLTRLNNRSLFLNSDLIKFVEQSPDTVVTLITGEKIVVLEKPNEVLARIVSFRRSVLEGVASGWDSSALHSTIRTQSEPNDNEPTR